MLATLALNANRVTSIDHLIDAVWGESPPASARSQIQKCVSELRKLFGDSTQPGSIRTHPPGYVLELAASDLDSEQFAGMVSAAREHTANGRIEEAAGTLRTALALWRGPALNGVRSDLVQRSAARLDDARLAAIEERVRLELELGAAEELSYELYGLIDEHPLRERLYSFLMLALYRCGRQADALEVCRRARTTLIEEVGIEPGQELRDMEQAILNRDPALDYRTSAGASARPGTEPQPAEEPVTPRQLPGGTADFVGRESHIAEIKRLLSDEQDAWTAPYAVRVIAVSGRGGVGKSTLAVQVAHELTEDFPDGHLYVDMQSQDGENGTATLLARFLRALGVAGTTVPEGVQERAELYRSLLANKRLLVVLDGVTSEEHVRPLLPGDATCPVIVTSRARLTGLTGAYWIDIDVFDTDQSIELLGKIIGPDRVRAEEQAAIELVNLCGGLPLALRIAAARLASRPRWRIAELVRRLANEARRLDELSHRGLELRSSIGLTYRSLSKPAQRLFRLFALIQAPDFPGWTADALLDAEAAEAEEALADLVDAQVLDILDYQGEHIRYRFHDLIQIFARERLGETESEVDRRNAVARLLGAWLALAEKAHRQEYGGDYTILHGTAPRWQVPERADTDPVEVPMGWWESERRALVTAVRQAAAEGMDELCWDLALTSVSLFEVKGYYDDWRETAQVAHDATELAGNRRGQAAMLYSLGLLHMYQKRLADAERCFTQALTMFTEEGSVHGCALVLRNVASVDRLHGNFGVMLARYEEALDKMRQVGDPVGQAYILKSLAKFRIDEGDVEVARTLLTEALTLCQRVGYRRGEASVLHRFSEVHLVAGQTALARQTVYQVLRIVRDIGDRTGETHALYVLGLVRRREGRLDNAETTLVHAVSLAGQIGEKLVEGKARFELGGIELARGNNSAARAHLVQARNLFDTLHSVQWEAKALMLLAEAHEGDGDIGLAVEELDKAAELLVKIESKEATRLLGQINKTMSALHTDGVVGRSADIGGS